MELIPDDRPPTRKQEQLITKLVKDFLDSKKLDEYSDYETKPTKANASAFITRALEENWSAVQQSDGYMKYIATRPRAERLGDHGLFGDEDGVDLEQTMDELDHYTGNVWTHIISLKRGDAARLGYDNARAWMNLLRANRNDIAAAMNIPPNHFRWYAAYHDEGDHPHVHMMAWSTVPSEAYLTREGIRNIKSQLTNQIFQQEMLHTYEQKSQSRDELVREARKAIRKLTQEMARSICSHSEIEQMADRSVRSCHAVCQMALDKAVEEKLIHGNPAAGCRLPPIKGREMQVLTQEEMRRFLIQAKAEGMYELFLLDLTTGMRRGELLALRWDDLDFATGKLRIDKQICPVGGKLIVSEPKTKAANRTIILPPAMVEVLAEYKKGIFSDLMFPSRVKPEQPIDPGYVRKRLQIILKRAGCKSVRFHDLRHTFATMSLENGMDVKTLSTIIGHVSSATTLNTYTHVTDEMRQKAAVNIDRGIAGVEAAMTGNEEKAACSEPEFTPVQPARRRPGTGYVKQIKENLWEGRYSPVWPDGKKHSRNVYGHTEAGCEEKLAELILQMKAEIAALRSGASTEYPDGVSPKKKAIAAYLRENPGVTNKAKIARDLNMDRTTVQRYYDEIRAELRGEESPALRA